MTENQFIEELKRELKRRNVSDIDDIISEYVQHFEYKKQEGKTEEEIARRLSSPQDIANDYGSVAEEENIVFNQKSTAASIEKENFEITESENESKANDKKHGEKWLKITEVSFLSLFFVCFYVLFIGLAISFAALTLGGVGIGICLIFSINIQNLIPFIPALPSVFMGISFICLAFIAAIASYYMFKVCGKVWKGYFGWCADYIRGTVGKTKSNDKSGAQNQSESGEDGKSSGDGKELKSVKNPKKNHGKKVKILLIIAFIVMIITLAVAYLILCKYTGSFEPWHVYKWFE